MRIEIDGDLCPAADGKTELEAVAFVYGFELVTGHRVIVTQGAPKKSEASGAI
jgi:hypothetical protein